MFFAISNKKRTIFFDMMAEYSSARPAIFFTDNLLSACKFKSIKTAKEDLELIHKAKTYYLGLESPKEIEKDKLEIIKVNFVIEEIKDVK